MDFLEKDLEEIVFNADSKYLIKKGLGVFGLRKRQLRIGNYGIADMVTFDREGHGRKAIITVYEFKKDKIGISAFLQALGYLKGISEFIGYKDYNIEYRIVLVGKSVDTKSTFCYLPEMIPPTEGGDYFLNLYTYSYDIDGISFKDQNGYSLIDNGFLI